MSITLPPDADVTFSNCTITNSGMTPVSAGYGYCNSTATSITTSPWTTYSSVSQPTYTIKSAGLDHSDVVIKRHGKSIAVAKSLETIIDHLCIIIPDAAELANNPALKTAYDHYLDVVRESLDPRIRAAYDSFQTLRSLTQED